MEYKVYINDTFKSEVSGQICNTADDYITIYRSEGEYIFFKYGKCKYKVTKKELEERYELKHSH
jgi:hypothetical protein